MPSFAGIKRTAPKQFDKTNESTLILAIRTIRSTTATKRMAPLRKAPHPDTGHNNRPERVSSEDRILFELSISSPQL